jgi:hypothetical protein
MFELITARSVALVGDSETMSSPPIGSAHGQGVNRRLSFARSRLWELARWPDRTGLASLGSALADQIGTIDSTTAESMIAERADPDFPLTKRHCSDRVRFALPRFAPARQGSAPLFLYGAALRPISNK